MHHSQLPKNLSNYFIIRLGRFSICQLFILLLFADITIGATVSNAIKNSSATTMMADYSISTVGNVIEITDNSNNSDVLLVIENAANIEFNVTGTTRTFSLNGGIATNMPAIIPLAGITSIIVNTKGGNDNINFGAFTNNALPSFTVNGGTGDDVITFFGNINFQAGANLDLNLQNDDAPVGMDRIIILGAANLVLSGTGTADIKVSRSVIVNLGASLVTENGDLTVEANQQAPTTAGSFSAVTVDRGLLQANGSGNVTVKGKGGSTGSAFSVGISVNGPNGKIASASGNVNVTGHGGGTGASLADFGVAVQSSGMISTGANGTISVTGYGGTNSSGNSNGGVLVNTGGSIISTNGSTTVTGTGGGTSTSASNYGVIINDASSISSSGTGSVTVIGNAGTTTGNDNFGVYVV